MDFKTYAQTKQQTQLPPNLDAGMEFKSINSIQQNEFDLNGEKVKGMRVFTDKGEYKTSSGVIMDILATYFKDHKEPITNVKVISPRGKRYLTLEGI